MRNFGPSLDVHDIPCKYHSNSSAPIACFCTASGATLQDIEGNCSFYTPVWQLRFSASNWLKTPSLSRATRSSRVWINSLPLFCRLKTHNFRQHPDNQWWHLLMSHLFHKKHFYHSIEHALSLLGKEALTFVDDIQLVFLWRLNALMVNCWGLWTIDIGVKLLDVPGNVIPL